MMSHIVIITRKIRRYIQYPRYSRRFVPVFKPGRWFIFNVDVFGDPWYRYG